MTPTAWIAILVILITIYCLIKRYETRMVLIASGLAMGNLLLHGLCLCCNHYWLR